jgi:hypothetical protein
LARKLGKKGGFRGPGTLPSAVNEYGTACCWRGALRAFLRRETKMSLLKETVMSLLKETDKRTMSEASPMEIKKGHSLF